MSCTICWTCWACASQPFQPRFEQPKAPGPSVVMSELVKTRPRDERAIAVGLTQNPSRLFAWGFQRGLLWERAVEARSAPLIAADAVVLQEQQGVVVRDLQDGAVRSVLDEHAALVGADGAGHELVVSMANAGPNGPGSIAFVDASGMRWKRALGLPVGVPACAGPYLVVPWATQRISVLDKKSGAELARYHYRNTVMGEALVQHGRLYVGQLGLLPVDRDLLEHPFTKREPFSPVKRALPGQPALLRDGYVPIAEPDSATHRLQVTWGMADSTAPAAEADLLALRFYRLLFGMQASADALRWVRVFDHDLVGVAVQAEGLWVADSAGQLRYLDRDGNSLASTSIGRALRAIALRPAGFVPQAGAAVSGAVQYAAPPASEAGPSGLRQQVYAAAALDDDRLSAGRAYAASYLGRFAEPEATGQLVELCTQMGLPEPVRLAACAELTQRTNGGPAVLQALRVRASFLEGTPAPPVGALAQAAAKLQLKAAGPLLISQLEDPNTQARDLQPLLQALEALAERSALGSVERFVRLHHAEPEGSELAPALSAALHALGALKARGARHTLSDVAHDPLTPKSTRAEAEAALAQLDAPPPTAASRAHTSVDEEHEAAPQDEVQTDPRPYALTPEVVRKTLWPLRARLGRCLTNDPSGARSGRSSLVVSGDGQVEGVFVLPATLQACVEPVLREAHFPSTRLGRQRITHVFYAPNAVVNGKHPARKGKR